MMNALEKSDVVTSRDEAGEQNCSIQSGSGAGGTKGWDQGKHATATHKDGLRAALACHRD